ncbi:MAG: TrmH family RNA methyltransferase [Fimbriimonadales bacterium]
MENLEAAVRRDSYEAADAGLRDRFAGLPRAPIRIICCTLDKGINHGNVLRIAECFRAEEVCFSPVSRRKERDFSGGFAALKWQPYRWVETAQAVQEAKHDGFTVYGLTLADRSAPLRHVKWRHPAAIVLGQEWLGIDEDVLPLCDELIGIPLYGLVQSLNVAVAAALATESCFARFVEKNASFAPARQQSTQVLD